MSIPVRGCQLKYVHTNINNYIYRHYYTLIRLILPILICQLSKYCFIYKEARCFQIKWVAKKVKMAQNIMRQNGSHRILHAIFSQTVISNFSRNIETATVSPYPYDQVGLLFLNNSLFISGRGSIFLP